MSEINFNTYIDPNAIEEKSIEKTHLSQDIQESLDNVASGITVVAINQEVDDANITNYITNPVFTQELNKKQNVISDLSTIRSNAEKATTAVQPNQVSSLAVTGIKMNGSLKGVNGVVDLGAVITSLPAATTAVTGVVRLTSSTSSNAEDVAATPKAVTAVSTLANSAYNKIKNHLSAVTTDYTTGHTANQLYGQNSVASRSFMSDPNDYNRLFKFTGLKYNSALGLNNEGTYSSVVGVRAWYDSSGGPAHEFAFTEKGKMYHRYGNESGNTSWLNWNKIVESNDLTQYVTTGTSQNISGVKKFTSNIEIGNGTSAKTSVITSQIDSGELKLYHSGTTKGFIIRTNKNANPNANLFPLELLTTNNSSSYQYNFPTQTGGIVALSAKINGNVYTPSTTGGTIDLGDNYLTPTNINDEVLFENLEEVTYNELLNLVNTCSLVKGRNYRIIDYITTTTQEDTQSAGKPFDVIVTALSNNTLDENAKVCQPKGQRKTHGGAIYGINGVIKSDSAIPYNWTEITLDKKLKKVIYDYEAANNNTIQNEYKIVRNGYTVSASGGTLNVKVAPRENNARVVGVEICDVNNSNYVIDYDYHLSDITTNNTNFTGNYYVSVPSDGSYFVRLIFIKPTSASSKVYVEIQNYSGHYFNENDLSKWVIKYDIHNDTNKYLWADATNGKGVIYYMKDEFDNECPYDFKNIKFKRTKEWVDNNVVKIDSKNNLSFSETEKYFYTFDYNGNDDSLCRTGSYKCEQNYIGKLLSKHQQQLNNTIFLGNGNANNKIAENNKNNTIGVDSYNNIIGVNFQENVMANGVAYNNIGNGFKNNICKAHVQHNNIGHLVSNNYFGFYVLNNVFKTRIQNNTFAGTVTYNEFGNDITNNEFIGYLTYNNIKSFLKYCKKIPSLYLVTIETGILNGDSANTINVQNMYINNTLFNDVMSKQESSNKPITLFKDNDGIYKIAETKINVGELVELTYAELKTLRDAGKLIPGQKYCITDYTATVKDGSAISAGYIFNIIVEAVNPAVLSEITKARVAYNNNDSNSDIFKYNRANLNAWEIKYCLDNDDSRFDWADAENGKGVIYYMKDEWGNECPYDFKSIQFVIDGEPFFTFNEVIDGKPTNLSINNDRYSYNIFGVYGNVIKPLKKNNKLSLNHIILKRNCNNNTFENNCYSNILGTGCTINTFGVDCSGNTFGNNCVSINFNEKCKDNNLGNNCSSVIFSNHCTGNTLGNNVLLTSFGSNCINNTLGNYYQSITFGTYCTENKIIKINSNNEEVGVLEYVRHFTFGDAVQRNTFQTTVDTKSDEYLQMYKINSYIIGKTINLSAETQRSYTTTIARNSSGYIKQYCEGDLIL